MSQKQKKCVGLNPASQVHYTDHLAVMSVLMNMPLLFMEEADCEFAKKYYPGLNAQIAEFNDFNKEFLIANYDALFMSDLWNQEDFHAQYHLLEMKYNKRLRSVYVPHGFSDKGFYLKDCVYEDIALIYGQNMMDLLKHQHVLDKLNSYVITGNYRYTYFKKNRDFYDRIVQEEIFNKLDKTKPTILYAPTWMDAEESTTFFDSASFFSTLPNDFNMIVKLHPRLELDDVANYYNIIGKHEGKPNMLFIKDFPSYPLMALADAFLTDLSAMGYDFLAFNKPMFFLNKHRRNSQTDRGLFLYRCGVEILPENFDKIYRIIKENIDQDNRFKKIRSDIYEYTFGKERPFLDIKHDILKVLEEKDVRR